MTFKLITKTFKILPLFLLFTVNTVHCYLPISEKVELRDRGTFVLSTDDDYDQNEDEIIQPEHVEPITALNNDETNYLPLHFFITQCKRQITRGVNNKPNQVIYKNVKTENTRKKVSARFKRGDTDIDDEKNEENTIYNYITSAGMSEIVTSDTYDSTETHDTSTIPMMTSRDVKLATTQKSDNHYDLNYPESNKSTNYDEITGIAEEATASEKETPELLVGPLEREKEEKMFSSTEETAFGSSTTSKSTKELDEKRKNIWTITRNDRLYTVLFKPNTTSTRKGKTTADEKDQIAVTSATTKILKFEKILPEYSFEFEDVQSENATFNFTDDEIEKSLKTMLKNSFNFGKVSNCSEFFGWKYGIKAFDCAMSNLTHAKNRTEIPKLLLKTWKITRIWLAVYLCLAIPCWCHKGWCCCCFRCKLCFPGSFIKKEKKYYVENPPGLLLHRSGKRGEPLNYEPSLFETIAYEKFGNTLRNI